VCVCVRVCVHVCVRVCVGERKRKNKKNRVLMDQLIGIDYFQLITHTHTLSLSHTHTHTHIHID